MILLIDNYDSFTYNLLHQLPANLVTVMRNDDSELMATAEKAQAIIFSPGPGRPEQAGQMPEVIAAFYKAKPMLGICLGHQAIAQFFGADIVQSPVILHGKRSEIEHQQQGLFKSLQDNQVMRYHSLIVEENSLPKELFVAARVKEDQIIMGIQHKSLPIYGLQFHPESIGTEKGQDLINSFLEVLEESA